MTVVATTAIARLMSNSWLLDRPSDPAAMLLQIDTVGMVAVVVALPQRMMGREVLGARADANGGW
jgi:hypothetical protein